MTPLSLAKLLTKSLLKPAALKDARSTLIAYFDQPDATCSCCGFVGKFRSFGAPPRAGVWCPQCESLERHRLVALAFQRGFLNFSSQSVLHFAAEPSLQRLIRNDKPSRYVRADIDPNLGDVVLNIEDIHMPDGSFDAVFASHVLEHVDDRKALTEIARVLKPGGTLVVLVPMVEGWRETYENPAITSERDRLHHFGLWDHQRLYGADIRQRIKDAGFSLDEFTANGSDSVTYRLQRGETVFKATNSRT